MKIFRSPRPAISRRPLRQPLFRLFSFGLLSAILPALGSAAQILDSRPSLSTIIDLTDFGPLAADELFDIRSGNPLVPAYVATAQTTNTQNDNSAQCTVSINATLDAAALKFGATGSARFDAFMNFDANDIASGAFVDAGGTSSYSIQFRIAGSGKVRLGGAILAAGPEGNRSSLRIERLDGSGVALWNREVTDGAQTVNEEVSLTQGDYLFVASASSGNNFFNKAGSLVLTSSASYDFSAEVIETAPPPKGKGKPRR